MNLFRFDREWNEIIAKELKEIGDIPVNLHDATLVSYRITQDMLGFRAIVAPYGFLDCNFLESTAFRSYRSKVEEEGYQVLFLIDCICKHSSFSKLDLYSCSNLEYCEIISFEEYEKQYKFSFFDTYFENGFTELIFSCKAPVFTPVGIILTVPKIPYLQLLAEGEEKGEIPPFEP